MTDTLVKDPPTSSRRLCNNMAVDIDPAISGQEYSAYSNKSQYSTPGLSSSSMQFSSPSKHLRNDSGSNYTTANIPPPFGYSQNSPTSASSVSSISSYTGDQAGKELLTTYRMSDGSDTSSPSSGTYNPSHLSHQQYQQHQGFSSLINAYAGSAQTPTSHHRSHTSSSSNIYLNTTGQVPILPVNLNPGYVGSIDETRFPPQQTPPQVNDLSGTQVPQSASYYGRGMAQFNEYDGLMANQSQFQFRQNMPPPQNYQQHQPRLSSSNLFMLPNEVLLPGSNNTTSASRSSAAATQPVPYSNFLVPTPTANLQFTTPATVTSKNYIQYNLQQAQSQEGYPNSSSLSNSTSTTLVANMSDYVPLNVGSWDTNQLLQSQQPYKPLLLLPGESLESTIMSRLACRNNSNEYSPIFKADSRFNINVPSRSGQKVTRIENLLRTRGTTRTFQTPGIYSGRNGNLEGDSNPQGVSGQEILQQVITAIYEAVGTSTELQSYMSPITDIALAEARREPTRGVKKQLELPDGISLIMDARHKHDIEQTFLKWKSSRPKTENFFRLEDKKGHSFSLEELKEALDIIMSRPPRRINNYVSRQLLTDVTYSQGRGVTEFSSSQLTHLHSLSKETRQPGHFSPAGSVPLTHADGSVNSVQALHYEIPHEDMPFVNSKKSCQYDPHYCRRHGAAKEGWCGYCKMGGWYLMKNSGYLYHQNHEHGLFPGGCVFEDPLVIRRKVIREARWEGLCGICYHWIDLDHTDRKLWGTWYRHYKLCVNEYEEIKKTLRSTFAPIELVEITYRPADSQLTQ